MKGVFTCFILVLFLIVSTTPQKETIFAVDPTLPNIVPTLEPLYNCSLLSRIEKAESTSLASLTSLTGNNDVCIPGQKVDACKTWRMVNAIILKNSDDLENNVATIKDYLNQTTKKCSSSSQVQWLVPRYDNSASDCQYIYNFNTIAAKKALNGFNNTRMLISDSMCSEPGEALFVFMQKINSCIIKNQPIAVDGAILNIFTDMNLEDLCGYRQFTNSFKDLIESFRSFGFYIKFIFVTREIEDQSVAETLLPGCQFKKDDAQCEILDSTSLDQPKSYEICLNDITDNNNVMGDISIQMLLIIGIPSISLTVCCIGFFVCCLKCARLKLAFARLQMFGNDGETPNPNFEHRRGFFHRRHRHQEVTKLENGESKNEWDRATKGNNYMDINALADANKKDVWEIESRNLLIQEDHLLGNGAFANVYKGIVKGKIPLYLVNNSLNLVVESENKSHHEAAVKKLPPHADQQNHVDFFHEIEFMKRLGHHAHVISMLGCVSNPYEPLIVVEYCARGDLLKFLRRHKDYVLLNKTDDCPIEADMCLRIKDLVSISWQVADGLAYLASKNFIHRDLAARNVLLTKNLTAKISDFGLCRYMDSALYTAKGGRLPIKWMSIEALKQYEFSSKSDVWSYGVLLFEIFSMGDVPYPTVQPVEMLDHLQAGMRLGQPLKCPNEIYQIMQRCWEEKPENRPEANEIRTDITMMLNLDDESYGYLNIESDDGTPKFTSLTMQQPHLEKKSRSYSTKMSEVKTQKCQEVNQRMAERFGEEQATEIQQIFCEVFSGVDEINEENGETCPIEGESRTSSIGSSSSIVEKIDALE